MISGNESGNSPMVQGLIVACTFVDSGGHYTDEVYKYCGQRLQSRVFPIKGEGGSGLELIRRSPKTTNTSSAYPPWCGFRKNDDHAALHIAEPGPHYFHFPIEEERGYDQIYFKGLVSERQVFRKRMAKRSWFGKMSPKTRGMSRWIYGSMVLQRCVC
ncbi:terminase gpA endonuclease subunit [Brevibacillus brevis]|uniref:terminase gpA endonuclease subunit n=1 Tax=Brevibacillus brevis TaxID=1393 RepID=UPI003642D112